VNDNDTMTIKKAKAKLYWWAWRDALRRFTIVACFTFAFAWMITRGQPTSTFLLFGLSGPVFSFLLYLAIFWPMEKGQIDGQLEETLRRNRIDALMGRDEA
jgi:hypothetical protein